MTHRTTRAGVLIGTIFASCICSASAQTIIIDPRPVPPIHPPPPHPHPPPPPRPPWPPRPRPPLRDMRLQMKMHNVQVSIVDGVAVTSLDQVFFNPHDRTVEGTYIFPLDDDIALSKFSMYVNGQEVEGKLLGVEEARRQYESIVASKRDPALLEFLGTRMFRARIFPINPKSEARVKLSYTQMLSSDDGIVRYRYPLGIERHSGSPIEDLGVLVSIESKTPIKSVFSPSHKIAVSRPTDYKAGASYEAKNVLPDKNFELYYALSDKEFGLTVLTYRAAGEHGFYLARIAPPAGTAASDVLPKDISFVIDTSGSMAGDKIEQARSALSFCVSNLNKEDRFNIIPFSHEATSFRDTLVPATPENVAEARKFADELRGVGGTNINDALLTAIKAAPDGDSDRPYLIVFLTDGQPTVSVTDPEEILKNVSRSNEGRIRLYVFGVGYDVNTRLLDLLAEQNRGARDYVEPGEDLELRLSSFYRKVAEPVLADPSLSFSDLNVYDQYPPKLGDLFAGGELVVVGRYKGQGAKAIELTGTRRGTKERFVYETTFPSEGRTNEFLPRLWATRKVGFLLDQIRLHGEDKELKDTIVQLAAKYGIVTPYTAYLVTEPGGVAWRQGGRDIILEEALASSGADFDRVEAELAFKGAAPDARGRRLTVPTEQVRANVRASKKLGAIQYTDAADLAGSLSDRFARPGVGGKQEAHELVARAGSRTFYRVGERWVDADYDKKIETRKIEAFSEEYFELIRKYPDLAKCFALGERVIVMVSDTTYESVPAADE